MLSLYAHDTNHNGDTDTMLRNSDYLPTDQSDLKTSFRFSKLLTKNGIVYFYVLKFNR